MITSDKTSTSLPISQSAHLDSLENGQSLSYVLFDNSKSDDYDELTTHSQKESMDRMLHKTLDQVGRSAFGIIYILAGGLEDEPVEWWDSVFLQSEPSEALKRLTDKSHKGYIPLDDDIMPGVGLLGALWNEVSWNAYWNGEKIERFQPRNAVIDHKKIARVKLLWRDLEGLSIDPDQPYDPRLKLIVEAGVGKAVAVPYYVNGLKGIVVFGARKTADQAKIQSSTNSLLLSNAAGLVGSLIAFRRSYNICREQRIEERDSAFRRLKMYLTVATAFKGKNSAQKNEKKRPKRKWVYSCTPRRYPKLGVLWSRFRKNFKKFIQKCFGAKVSPPPALPLRPSLYCGFATFVSCLLWSLLNEKVINISDARFKLVRGSYGSLISAQYLLFAAPASQPWNAFVSQIFTGAIAMAINQIPGLPIWFRTALIPAVVVFTMGKTGAIHPTAGGDALLFAYYGCTWDEYVFVLCNYAFGIIVAVIINNLNRNRQYPNYWTAFRRLKCIKTL